MKLLNFFKKRNRNDRIFSFICRTVSNGTPFKTVISKSRKRNVCEKRQIIQTLACWYTTLSKTEIGKRTNRNHATVIYSQKAILNAVTTDKQFRDKYLRIEFIIKNKVDTIIN